MKITVSCTACPAKLSCDAALVGKPITCPKCKAHFTARPLAAEKPLDVLPVEPPILDAVRAKPAPRRRQRAVEIDPEEAFEQEADNSEDAATRLEEWQAAMPEKPSAYQPSGVLPTKAIGTMTLGAVVGIVAGALTELGIGVLAGAIVVAIAYLMALMVVAGVIFCFVVVIFGFIGLVALLVPFLIGGRVTALVTTRFGRMAKNRNGQAAGIFSAASGGFSVLVAAGVFAVSVKGPLDQLGLFGTQPGGLNIVYLVIVVVGCLLTALISWAYAADYMAKDKFCEDCEQFMDEKELKKLRLGGVRAMTKALVEEQLETAGELLAVAAGDDGTVALFTCPECQKGYVEVRAQFKARWREKKEKKELEKSWLTASTALTPEEMKLFKVERKRRR